MDRTTPKFDAPTAGEVARIDGEMVELALLLPDWQVEVLDAAARGRGLTSGQMIRRLINEFFTGLHDFRPRAEALPR